MTLQQRLSRRHLFKSRSWCRRSLRCVEVRDDIGWKHSVRTELVSGGPKGQLPQPILTTHGTWIVTHPDRDIDGEGLTERNHEIRAFAIGRWT